MVKFVSVLSIAIGTLSLASAQTYHMIDLGTLGGRASVAQGLNNNNEVTGGSTYDGTDQYHAFRYSNGVMQDLGALSGNYSYGAGINSFGAIAGIATTFPPSTNRSVVFENGVINHLGSLGGGSGYSTTINDAGQVTGTSAIANGDGHAFLYHNGVMTDLGTLSGGRGSVGRDITANGKVVGTSTVNGFTMRHGFLYENGVMTDLGTFGGFEAEIKSINESGSMTGVTIDINNKTRAFVYANGVQTDLGTFGGTQSNIGRINENGVAVGWANTPDDQWSAFVYSGGAMVDLNTISDAANDGWRIEYAVDINDFGWISGTATKDNRSHAILLQPVPEPASMVALLLGLVPLVRRARRSAR